MLALLHQAPHELTRQRNEPQLATATAAGLSVAALREVHEECGVLFAQSAAASHAREAGQPACIEPEPFDGDDGHRVTCYHGDARHRLRQRMMPGPTRLVFRNRRSEPPAGFDTLLRPAPSADE